MAALHLLPRELVHLLASRPALPASPSHPGYRFSGSLFAQQLPRFSSDYRRISLDSETARDFDRPSDGYEYPSIAGEQASLLNEASFIEEDDADYHFKMPPASTSSPSFAMPGETQELHPQVHMAVGARALSRAKLHSKDTLLSAAQMHHLAMNNSANCLKRDDLDAAAAWFIDAPVVPIAFANQYARIAGLAHDLRDRLLQEKSNNIPLLMSFASACASKGFPHSLYRLVPHIARFSTYERLQPFWTDLSQQSRRTFKLYRPANSMSLLERTLNQIENRVIRTLYLSENYLDALNFLKDVRNQERRLADPHDMSIESETYRIFLEELERHDTHPALYSEVEALCKADYGRMALPSPPSVEQASGRATSVSITDDYYPAGSSIEKAASRASRLRFTAKDEYNKLSAIVMRGESINRQTLSKFSKLCVANNAAYLARSLARIMAMSTSEKEYRHLMNMMRQGELPTARRLSAFIDACVRSQHHDLATKLGTWMEQQGLRFRGLWMSARIHRLIRQGSQRAASDALQLYKEQYLWNGLPQPITQYFEHTGNGQQDRTGYRQKQSLMALSGVGSTQPADLTALVERQLLPETLRIPASSHSIALAIQAWLILNPHESNVNETYRSFLAVSYADNEDVRIPSQLMPDQVSFGPFLKNLSRNGKHAQGMRVLDDMRKRGVMPNAHNWDTVIGAFAKAGNHKVVASIVRRMEEAQELLQGRSATESEEEPADTFASDSSMTKASVVAGTRFDPELGDIHRLLEGFQFYPPTLVTYTTTIKGFAMAKRLDKARYYRKKMFLARGGDGGMLYSFGQSPKADAVLDMVAQMSDLAEVGRRVTHGRVFAGVR